jgi:large subunit ribosomal protein L19
MAKKSNKKFDILPGDVVKVERKVIEGDKERIQIIEGTVIARKHGEEKGATFTLRRISNNVGVEFIFPLHSPRIKKITVIKRSKTRRAKLYYLREKTGKGTRIKEDKQAKIPGAITKEKEKKESNKKLSKISDKKEEKKEQKETQKKDKEKKGKKSSDKKTDSKKGKK